MQPIFSRNGKALGTVSRGTEVTRRILSISGTFLLIVVVLFSAVWANLAILYQLPGCPAIRIGACLVFDVVALSAVTGLALRRYRRAALVYAVVYIALLAWWASIHPSNDKDWAAAVAHGVTGSLNGDRLTVENVRNFSWDSETDFVERWEQRTYDLSKLRSLDLYLVYWMGPAIAHTIMSFGFQDGRYLDFSIEVRRTRNDEYSAIAGFFKTNELVYIGADATSRPYAKLVMRMCGCIVSERRWRGRGRCSFNISTRQTTLPRIQGSTIRLPRTAPPPSLT